MRQDAGTGKGGARSGLNIVMLGPPGAGKGTQAERLAQKRQLPRISTGDILREAVQQGVSIGEVARLAMDAGRLVSDDVMICIVEERLNRPDAHAGFVLDGFPRTVDQAAALDRMVDGRGPLVVLDVVVDQAENCFPMIPSGAAHNEMLMGPEDKAERPVSEEGMVLV